MGKIVIPKHSADVDEMNAVLKIHYDAGDWVKSKDYIEELIKMIGPHQYPTSYPKKAQVPAYFGFLECKMTKGKNITERKITESGKKMYEAIISDDIAVRQEILMNAVEKVIFGKINGGSPTSESDIDAPDLVIRCILDTGYCTSHEYGYMIWNLHDNGKKYYQSLSEILQARKTGGIVLPAKAKTYTDWKPILALIRWGFLKKADDRKQKVMIHPDVYLRYGDRLENIKVYNIDKLEQIEINSIQESDSVDDTVFKPFAISEESSMQIRTGTLREEIVNVEKQHIYTGDSVLFVNRSISRLLAYHSYLINDMTKVGTKYQMSLEIEGAVNRRQEDVLLAELKEEARRQNENDQHGLLIDILNYSKYMQNIKGVSEKNQDIEPVNLVIRALGELDYLHENELKYLLAEMILGNLNYSDAIDLIIEKRNLGVIITSEREAELDYKFVNALVAGRLLEWSETDAGKVLRLAEDLDSTYLEQLKRLMVYAVDISKSSNKKDNASLPLSIKAVSVDDSVGNKELSEICIRIIENPKIVQGDYIILVKNDFCCIANYMVYQVISVQKSDEYMKLELAKHSFINKDKEDEILKDLKEAYYGECE
jgi:hypothetical protein